MKTVLAFTLLFVIAAFVVINYTTSAKNNNSISELKSDSIAVRRQKLNNVLTIKVKDMDGKEVLLSSFKGKVLLIVNVASQCATLPSTKDFRNFTKSIRTKDY